MTLRGETEHEGPSPARMGSQPPAVEKAQSADARPTRTFIVAPADAWPDQALTRPGARNKSKRRHQWRQALMQRFGGHSRLLRVAWLIYDLADENGYCFASDGHLAKEAGLTVENVQAALTTLTRAGAIIREHVPNGRMFERRIYQSASILTAAIQSTPQDGEVGHPPPGGGSTTPRRRGTEKKPHARGSRRSLSTSEQARRAAEHREARRRGDAKPFFEDD